MSLVKGLTCECSPGRQFASRASCDAHKKTQKHCAWEAGCRSDKIEATRRDNANFTLTLKLADRDETIERLYGEKRELTKLNEALVRENNTLNSIIEELSIKLKKYISKAKSRPSSDGGRRLASLYNSFTV